MQPKIIFGTVGVAEPLFVSELGTKAEHVMGFAQWVTNLPESEAPGIQDFITKYKNKYGEDPACHAAGGYAAVYVIKEAVEQAKTFTNKQKLRDTIASLSIDTIWGHVSFTSSGVISGAGYMVQILNGEIETVYPTSYKTADIVFPIPWSSMSQAKLQLHHDIGNKLLLPNNDLLYWRESSVHASLELGTTPLLRSKN